MFLTLYCPNPVCNSEHRVAHYLSGLRIWCINCTLDFGVPEWPVDWLSGGNPVPRNHLSDALEIDLYRIDNFWLQNSAAVLAQIQEELERHTPTEHLDLTSRVRGVIEGILWKGLTTRQNRERRLGPIPLLLQMRCLEPLPLDRRGLLSRYLRFWAFAYNEWRSNLHLLGEDLVRRT